MEERQWVSSARPDKASLSPRLFHISSSSGSRRGINISCLPRPPSAPGEEERGLRLMRLLIGTSPWLSSLSAATHRCASRRWQP